MDFARITRCGIVPVIKINNAEDTPNLVAALLKGGIDVIEITLRTDAAEDAIREAANFAPDMLVGAGTVINAGQLNRAVDAGARFIVSPGFNADVVKAGKERGVPVLPGVVTPSEIIAALEAGLSAVKFFPAENYGGVSTVKALSAPFAGVSFVPTGGITEKNAADYWRLSAVAAIGGSWIAPEKLIEGGEFGQITELSREATEIFKSVRGK